jgi:hypothetical protein
LQSRELACRSYDPDLPRRKLRESSAWMSGLVILRRIVQHLRDQKWAAVGLELVIVVLGVFIGIQVSNWNEARLESEQQERFIERLSADFQSIKRRIDSHFVTFEGGLEATEYILQLLRFSEPEFRESAIDPQRLEDAVSALYHLRIPPGSSATYLEMVAAGQLSALGNSALRDKLAEYERLTRIHLEAFRLAASEVAGQRPIMLRHYKLRSALDAETLSGMRVTAERIDLEGMRSDPEFEIALVIVQTSTRNNYGLRRLEARVVDEILTLLDAELAQ